MNVISETFVRDRLKGLADRGVFRGLVERPGRGGSATYQFGWLYGRNFGLYVDGRKRRIVFRNILPAIAYPSFLDRNLRLFVAGRCDDGLPPHRRVDPGKAELRYTNKQGASSLSIVSLDGDLEYAVKALLNTTKDLFSYLHMYHIEYLHRNFGVPEE